MMLRRNGTESLFPRRQGQDWQVGSRKRAWYAAAEAVFDWIEQAILIRWPLEVRYLGNVEHSVQRQTFSSES